MCAASVSANLPCTFPMPAWQRQSNNLVVSSAQDDRCIELPSSILLAVKDDSQCIEVGDYVVLHSLVKRPDLVGRVGRVTSAPAAGGSSSSSSSRDPEAR